MLIVTCKGLYSYVVDSVSIVGNKGVIVLSSTKAVKLLELSEILLIEPNKG